MAAQVAAQAATEGPQSSASTGAPPSNSYANVLLNIRSAPVEAAPAPRQPDPPKEAPKENGHVVHQAPHHHNNNKEQHPRRFNKHHFNKHSQHNNNVHHKNNYNNEQPPPEEDKKEEPPPVVKYVEAPLPKINPWAKKGAGGVATPVAKTAPAEVAAQSPPAHAPAAVVAAPILAAAHTPVIKPSATLASIVADKRNLFSVPLYGECYSFILFAWLLVFDYVWLFVQVCRLWGRNVVLFYRNSCMVQQVTLNFCGFVYLLLWITKTRDPFNPTSCLPHLKNNVWFQVH